MSLPSSAVARRGPVDGRWRLVLRGVGYLKYFEGGRLKFEVVVPFRFVRLLRVLIEARRIDAASATGTGGWRLRDDIGRLMGQETDWPLPADSISTYASTLKKTVLNEWLRMFGDEPAPALLEDKAGQGWRISPEVQIDFDENVD